MPLFDFLCKGCGHQFEEFISTADIDTLKCSHCESENLEKLPSLVGGYHINGDNAGSTRPKSAGSFKKKKTE